MRRRRPSFQMALRIFATESITLSQDELESSHRNRCTLSNGMGDVKAEYSRRQESAPRIVLNLLPEVRQTVKRQCTVD
jgi:hypothetical protein